ncbi:hypothetical protein SNOG_11989 [Parastagonospora nodorum SN15]|uniref:Uncharacterized protein n=1 Tax=Phaeosphaeria nodorum (strain SN15 / ATCC MYA-4574 / FGSC 10173) TaxID=321614 RepID=Q0U8C5_PHANO|nr:hypothetical protein SNOG_11989 [Parastagonospora nodorum SN15]EAT80401.1 hypothetical protein SNOG_11989 [Parastagonospora nodorum SN15]
MCQTAMISVMTKRPFLQGDRNQAQESIRKAQAPMWGIELPLKRIAFPSVHSPSP